MMFMNKASLTQVVEETTTKLLGLASFDLPQGVEKALRDALNREDDPIARSQLSVILKNIEIARKKRVPICQDTGIPMIHVSLGEDFPLKAILPNILSEAVRKATISIPLRPNAVHPFTRKNTRDNSGIHLPYLEWEIKHGDSLEILVIPKGFGSENMSQLGMLTPGEGLNGVKSFVLDCVVSAGGRPCPPTIIGVGVGLGVDGVMKLARRAAIRPLPLKNEDPDIASLETQLLKLVNETGIGPMGLGGKTTSLAVNIEIGHTHTGGLPVGVVFQCWAARMAEATVESDGKVKIA